MSDYGEMLRHIKRERETEEWVRSKDAADIVTRLHEHEDQILKLQEALEVLANDLDDGLAEGCSCRALAQEALKGGSDE